MQIFRALTFLSLFLLSFTVKAQFYFATDIDLAVVMSTKSDYNNGASGLGPGFSAGYRWGMISPEILFKFASASQIHDGDEGEFEVDIDSRVFGFGIRLEGNPYISSKMGFAAHEVEAEYTPIDGGAVESTIDGSKFGPYFGGGFKFPVFPGIEVYNELAFYLDSGDYSLFTIDLGVRYLIQ